MKSICVPKTGDASGSPHMHLNFILSPLLFRLNLSSESKSLSKIISDRPSQHKYKNTDSTFASSSSPLSYMLPGVLTVATRERTEHLFFVKDQTMSTTPSHKTGVVFEGTKNPCPPRDWSLSYATPTAASHRQKPQIYDILIISLRDYEA